MNDYVKNQSTSVNPSPPIGRVAVAAAKQSIMNPYLADLVKEAEEVNNGSPVQMPSVRSLVVDLRKQLLVAVRKAEADALQLREGIAATLVGDIGLQLQDMINDVLSQIPRFSAVSNGADGEVDEMEALDDNFLDTIGHSSDPQQLQLECQIMKARCIEEMRRTTAKDLEVLVLRGRLARRDRVLNYLRANLYSQVVILREALRALLRRRNDNPGLSVPSTPRGGAGAPGTSASCQDADLSDIGVFSLLRSEDMTGVSSVLGGDHDVLEGTRDAVDFVKQLLLVHSQGNFSVQVESVNTAMARAEIVVVEAESAVRETDAAASVSKLQEVIESLQKAEAARTKSKAPEPTDANAALHVMREQRDRLAQKVMLLEMRLAETEAGLKEGEGTATASRSLRAEASELSHLVTTTKEDLQRLQGHAVQAGVAIRKLAEKFNPTKAALVAANVKGAAIDRDASVGLNTKGSPSAMKAKSLMRSPSHAASLYSVNETIEMLTAAEPAMKERLQKFTAQVSLLQSRLRDREDKLSAAEAKVADLVKPLESQIASQQSEIEQLRTALNSNNSLQNYSIGYQSSPTSANEHVDSPPEVDHADVGGAESPPEPKSRRKSRSGRGTGAVVFQSHNRRRSVSDPTKIANLEAAPGPSAKNQRRRSLSHFQPTISSCEVASQTDFDQCHQISAHAYPQRIGSDVSLCHVWSNVADTDALIMAHVEGPSPAAAATASLFKSNTSHKTFLTDGRGRSPSVDSNVSEDYQRTYPRRCVCTYCGNSVSISAAHRPPSKPAKEVNLMAKRPYELGYFPEVFARGMAISPEVKRMLDFTIPNASEDEANAGLPSASPSASEALLAYKIGEPQMNTAATMAAVMNMDEPAGTAKAPAPLTQQKASITDNSPQKNSSVHNTPQKTLSTVPAKVTGRGDAAKLKAQIDVFEGSYVAPQRARRNAPLNRSLSVNSMPSHSRSDPAVVQEDGINTVVAEEGLNTANTPKEIGWQVIANMQASGRVSSASPNRSTVAEQPTITASAFEEALEAAVNAALRRDAAIKMANVGIQCTLALVRANSKPKAPLSVPKAPTSRVKVDSATDMNNGLRRVAPRTSTDEFCGV